jgi:hypothetical protein
MQFPSNYLEIIAQGAGALRSVAIRLRGEAVRHPEAPELWLVVRDCENLAARLNASDDSFWRDGLAAGLITGQDLGVVSDLLAKERHPLIVIPAAEAVSLARLSGFLRPYLERGFEIGGPAA